MTWKTVAAFVGSAAVLGVALWICEMVVKVLSGG